MLYRTLKRMIERGQTAGLEEKIDIFLRCGQGHGERIPGADRDAECRRYYRLIPSDLSLVTKGKSNG